MFRIVENLLMKARTEIMRRVVDDALLRLCAADEGVNARVIARMSSAYEHWTHELAPVEKLPNEAKHKIRKTLLRQAKLRLSEDVGDGYGLALLSLYVEAQAYEGEDADYVSARLQPMIDNAIRASAEPDDILDSAQCPGSSVG